MNGNLSVCICALNGLEYTKLLIASLRRHSRHKHEIVVYSDGSTDGTREWLREQPDILWQHDSTNRGICTAMNRAAAMASRRYLFFPNTDHVMAPGWDEALLARLETRTVVSCTCIEPGLVPVAPIFHAIDCGARWDEFDETRFLEAARAVSRPQAVDGVNYPFALSAELWREVGGLDERFNPGPANDPDLFYRLHLAGARMIRAEDAVAYHFSGKSSRMADEATAERREWHELTERNEARFAEKWGEPYRYTNGGLPDPGPEARRRFGRRPAAEAKSRLRVLVDARCVEPDMRGIGIYTANLVRALSRLPEGPEIVCATGSPELIDADVRCVRPDRLDGIRVDVAHGPAFEMPAGGGGAPAVVTIHDLLFARKNEWYPRDFAEHMQRVVAGSVTRAAALIAVSDHTAAELRRLHPDAGPIARIYEALPEEAASPATERDRRRAREIFAAGNDFILAVGVQQPRKNALGLVRAYGRLRERGRRERLVLVGGSDCEDPGVRQEVDRLGIGADACLTGRIAPENLRALYESCSVFVFPSFAEGFGLPLLEAMSAGAPIVCASGGAPAEVAGDAALYCDPHKPESIAEVIERILLDEGLRRQIVDRGHERLKAFSWERAARETLEVYERALTPRPVRVLQRPRIGIDARMAGLTSTGTGRYTSQIVPAMLRAAGEVEVVLFAPKQDDNALLPAGATIIEHVVAGPETLLDAAWEQFGLPSHLASCDAYFAPTGIVPVARPCPAVAVIHDLGFHENPEDYPDRLREHLGRWVPNTARSAERLVAVSGFTRDRLERLYGVSPERVSVIHHGRPRKIRPNGTGRREMILCISSFEPNKNLVTLVEAFGQIGGSWEMVVAGRGGRDLDRVRKACEGSPRVRLLVDPSDETIGELLSEAGIFAYPSMYEGFGMPLVEAMAAGLPVVAADAAACPEVVGEAGLLVGENSAAAWALALGGLIGDEAHRDELARRAIVRAGQFDWDRAGEATWAEVVRCMGAR